jgi:hypothetical protein
VKPAGSPREIFLLQGVLRPQEGIEELYLRGIAVIADGIVVTLP